MALLNVTRWDYSVFEICFMCMGLRSFRSLLLIATLFLLGCGNSAVLVTIHTTTPPRRLIGVNFGHACFGKSPTGEDQIVLVRQPIDDAPQSDADQPLVRQTTPALTQVLLIQIHWRTAPAGNSDSPVANNAVLHWYVYGQPSESTAGFVHYLGSGAVSYSPDGTIASVAIHGAELTLTERKGALLDPFQTFQINAKIKAVFDNRFMTQALEDLNQATKSALNPTSNGA